MIDRKNKKSNITYKYYTLTYGNYQSIFLLMHWNLRILKEISAILPLKKVPRIHGS